MEPPKVQGEVHNRKRLRCEGLASSSNKPYHQLTSFHKTQILNRVMTELVTEVDDRYLASLGSKKEVDELYAAWMDASIRMIALSRRNEPSEEIKKLKEEVEQLREKENKHFEKCFALETLLQKVKADLSQAVTCSAEDKKAYDTKLASLKTKAKDYKLQRNTAQKDLKLVREELESANKALGESNQQIKKLTDHLWKAKAVIIEEEWQNSEDCIQYNSYIGVVSYNMGMEEAVRQMKRALSEVAPDIPWETLEEKYNAIIAEDMRKLQAELLMAELLVAEDDKKGDNNNSEKLHAELLNVEDDKKGSNNSSGKLSPGLCSDSSGSET